MLLWLILFMFPSSCTTSTSGDQLSDYFVLTGEKEKSILFRLNQVISNFNQSRKGISTVKGLLNMAFQGRGVNSDKISADAAIYFEEPSSLRIDVFDPIGGDAARVEVQKGKVLISNYIQNKKRCFLFSPSDEIEVMNLKVRVTDLLNLIKGGVSQSCLGNSTKKIFAHKGIDVRRPFILKNTCRTSSHWTKTYYYFGRSMQKVLAVKRESGENETGKRDLSIQFSEFENQGKFLFPMQAHLAWYGFSGKSWLKFEYDRVMFNSNVESQLNPINSPNCKSVK